MSMHTYVKKTRKESLKQMYIPEWGEALIMLPKHLHLQDGIRRLSGLCFRTRRKKTTLIMTKTTRNMEITEAKTGTEIHVFLPEI